MSEPEEKFKPGSISNSVWDSDSDDGRPLIHFVSDRVRIMKIIFKQINCKRITQMAPKCLKEIPTSMMKSVLLDELMGISNKRLISIINNTNDPTKSSSSSEEETVSGQKPDDVISLDDISEDSVIIDDNFVEMKLSEQERLEMAFEGRQDRHKRKRKKSKTKHGKKSKVTVKKEDEAVKIEKIESADESEKEVQGPNKNDPFVSALNLLELQARARAIRSQLLNEITLDEQPITTVKQVNLETKEENNSCPNSPNSVVILSPERDIVEIDESSHSENEDKTNNKKKENTCNGSESQQKTNSRHEQEKKKDEGHPKENSSEIDKTKIDPNSNNADLEHVKNNKAPSPDNHEKVPTPVIEKEQSPELQTDKLSTTIEEDNDVLIMNEDEDILL